MKTLTKTFARRVISALLVTIMVFSLGITSIVSTSAAEVELAETGASNGKKTIYFQPDSTWMSNNAKLVAYTWASGYTATWTQFTQIGSTGTYFVEVNQNHNKIIFVRFSNTTTSFSFNYSNIWGRTKGDLDISTTSNMFKLTNNGGSSPNDAEGTWQYSYNTTINFYSNVTGSWTDKMMDVTTDNPATVYRLTLTLSAGTYYFKVHESASSDSNPYYGANSTVQDDTDGNWWQLGNGTGYTNNVTWSALGGTYVITYASDFKKITITNLDPPADPTTITNQKVNISTTDVTAGQTRVTLTASATVTNGVSTKYNFYVKAPGETDFTSKQNTATSTYSFTPMATGEYSYYVIVTDNGETAQTTTGTFTAKPAASLSNLEVDVEGTHQIVNEPVTLNVSYNATNVTNSAVELYLGSTKVNDAVYNSTNKTITFTPTTTGSQTYTVKVSGTNVTAITKDVTVNVLPVLNVGINGTPTSQYVGENVTVYVLSTTADKYGPDIIYSLFCNGTLVDSNSTGEFTVTQDVADTYEYSGKVSVAGYEAATTENLTLTFNPKTFSIDTFTSSVGDSIDENRDFTLTATVKFATEGEEVRYYLTFPDGTVVDNTEGVFGIRSKNLVDGVTSDVVTYKIYATCNGETTAVKELQMTIKEDTGTYPIKLLFKCSTVKGYQPQIKVNGNSVTAEIETTIEVDNVTGHGVSQYAWYSFYTQPDATYNQQINIEFKANRSAYYNVNYTLEVGSDDHTSVNGVDYYYLAIENLNAGRNAEVFNLSHWPEAERNWTESAVNMVFTENKDELPVELNKNEIATTSFNYRYANIGDANLDGDVNVKDATFVQKTVAGMTRTDSLVDFACDFNRDGRISIQDATAIQKQIAGL